MHNNYLPGILIAVLSVVCLLLILYGLQKGMMRAGWEPVRQKKVLLLTSAVFILWISLLGLLAYCGVFSDLSQLPPKPVLTIFLPLPFMLWLCFNKKSGQLLSAIPGSWLVFMQSFRIAVELILFYAFMEHQLPEQMTFSGYNWDILTGILAIPVGYFCLVRKNWPRVIVLLFNIAGLLLLLNVLIVALLSMPLPIRFFMHEPSTAIVGTFPFIYLPAVLVVLAYSLHIFSIRHYFLTRKV